MSLVLYEKCIPSVWFLYKFYRGKSILSISMCHGVLCKYCLKFTQTTCHFFSKFGVNIDKKKKTDKFNLFITTLMSQNGKWLQAYIRSKYIYIYILG